MYAANFFSCCASKLDLFSEAIVAIYGSKFKAANSSDRNFTQAKLKRRMDEIEANNNRYLAELGTGDSQEPAVKQARNARLNENILAMKLQMASLKEIEAKLEATDETQISLTDPDARSMMTRGLGIVGYNVQTTADAKQLQTKITSIGKRIPLKLSMSIRPGFGRLSLPFRPADVRKCDRTDS